MAGLRSRREGRHELSRMWWPANPRRGADSPPGGVGAVRRRLRPRLRPRRPIAPRSRRGHRPRSPAALEDGSCRSSYCCWRWRRRSSAARREVCERGHGAGLWAPIPAPKAAQILSGEGATRRVALRALGAGGATVAAAAGGLGAAVLNNRGWLPVAHDFFFTEVESPRQGRRARTGRARGQELSAPRPHRRDGVRHLARRRSHRQHRHRSRQRQERRRPGARRHRPRHHLLRHRARLLRHATPSTSSARR